MRRKISNPSQGRRPLKGKEAFTLVELLTVMAVIAVLIALISHSERNLNDSRKIDNAGNMLGNLAIQARQIASSRNAIVMLVVAEDVEGHLTLFTLLERTLEAGSWTQISRWEALPTGVSIDKAASQIASPGITPNPFPLRHVQRQIEMSSCQWVVVLPGGRLLGDENALYELRLTERAGDPNFYRVYINSMTGVAHTERP